MKGRKGHTTTLRVIQGRLIDETFIGPLRIVAAPTKAPPFHVDAFALEEDTFLVLSADAQVRDPKMPLTRIMTRLIDTKPATPGSVLVRGGRPLRFLAVVHDLNQEPSWKEEWITQALSRIFQAAERRELQAVALQMLGTVHGSLEKSRFVFLLRTAIEDALFHHLKRLWLIVPYGMAREVVALLNSQG
ncbi:MAG: hypothetical protein P8175_12665 [Deltaproteobacteria bacterium]